jgi:MFS family permease
LPPSRHFFWRLPPPVYAKCLEFLKKKTILYIAAALFIIGGVAPALIHPNIWVILFFRALIGIGVGICLPLSTDLVVDFFEDEERHSMMGYVSATVGISGIMFQLLGGYLAGIRWNYTFYAYLVSVIFFLFSFIFLPEPDRQAKIAAQEGAEEVQATVPGSVYLVAFIFGIYFLLWYVLPSNGAIVLLGEKMADPAQIGLAFAFVTVGSFISSVLFKWLFRAFEYRLLPISFVVSAAGFYICFISHTFMVFTMGATFLGLGLGMVVPATMTKLSGLVPYSAAAKAISIGYFGMGVGGFLQPLVFNLFSEPGRATFLIGALAMLVFTAVMYAVDKSTPVKATPEASSEASPA